MPQPPKIQQLDWLGSVQPLVGQMLKADGVTAGSVLLLDSVKNNTNGFAADGQSYRCAVQGAGVELHLQRGAGSEADQRPTNAGPVGG